MKHLLTNSNLIQPVFFRNSSRLLLFTTLFLSVIIGLSSCKKKSEELNNPGTSTGGTPAATFKAKIDGTSYVAQHYNGRVTTSGSLTLTAYNDDQAFDFEIPYYDGPGTYPFTDFSASASVTYFNSTITYSTATAGGGFISITSFNESNNTINGTFEFIGSSSFGTFADVTEGVFTNFPVLINVPTPPVGQAMYINYGHLITAVAARVHITDHYRFVIDIDGSYSRYRFHTHANPDNLNPLNFTTGFLVSQILSSGSMQNPIQNPLVSISEYNEEEQYVSGRIYSTSVDIDIRFNRIPLTMPTPVEIGQVVLTKPSGQVVFENAIFEYIWASGDEMTYRATATNSSNQKVVFQTTYGYNNWGPAHGYGYQGVLQFYENASGPVSLYSTGYFHSFGASSANNAGFVSYNETISAKGYKVPN